MHTEQIALPRTLTRPDFDQVVEVMACAFVDDPLWVYILPDEAQRAQAMRRLYRALFRAPLLSGQTFGVDLDGRLAGIATWSKPGDRVNPAAFLSLDLLRLLVSPWALRFRRAVPMFARFEGMQRHYAPEPHYYLNTIAVLPDAQGRGLASKLIRPFLARADAAGLRAYTETMTPANVPLYEHYGFRVVDDYAVPDTDLRIWAFLRPAR